MSPLNIYLLTSWIFIFFYLLPVGFCKGNVDQNSRPQDKSPADILSPKYWNSWEPSSNAAGVSWSVANDAAAGIPLSLKEINSRHSSQTTKQKSHRKNSSQGLGIEDFSVGDIRKKLISYGKSLLAFVTGLDSKAGLGLRNLFPDNQSSFSSRQSEPESEGRGVVDWLARLIGVQGKTLGEFLREYQVHVLYDLVFTFFKWVFFLYAGLLIP